jgi:hypothetical protein
VTNSTNAKICLAALKQLRWFDIALSFRIEMATISNDLNCGGDNDVVKILREENVHRESDGSMILTSCFYLYRFRYSQNGVP